MTFWIDYQNELESVGTIIRIRDETRYVQDLLTGEMDFVLDHLTWEERTFLRRKFFEVLCNKWYETFGEHIEPVPPEGPGIMWTIRYVEEGRAIDASRTSIEGG